MPNTTPDTINNKFLFLISQNSDIKLKEQALKEFNKLNKDSTTRDQERFIKKVEELYSRYFTTDSEMVKQ